MEKYITKSYLETVALAERIAKNLPEGTVIGYLGDLGAGKTAFTTGLVKGLGIEADVSSPTFAICNEYKGNDKTLYHFDMYRIDGWDDLYSTGFFDYLETEAYIAAEWSENIFGALPDDAVIVDISKISDNEREFKICKKGEMK
ncbi:MAG: tRNA (adenosine(37)-N6)-threonylcarbamoyltransferase complex ATPase subunit type 1 TsaE [Eubacterium sp.]|nr:tRNA (adenosine(37)-N6)-threonylcarbamoyltransferase complex ATPase subunit type 1 TsaE [Eubacterium sp.]